MLQDKFINVVKFKKERNFSKHILNDVRRCLKNLNKVSIKHPLLIMNMIHIIIMSLCKYFSDDKKKVQE